MMERDFVSRFGHKQIEKRVEEIFSGLSVDEICKMADEYIEEMPEWMPRFTLKRKGKVVCCKAALRKKLSRFEIK